ncbi:lipopolysaccharide heptosyltransferase family protein [Azospirillum brasilense]|uniref:glycosyltransferase family 9 protein n=1 Tax=Azospirillum argentinense TaxID=2970906 RepID=UPI00190E7625|nr:glycosyltransferase family 9 protein [Azospirillum argentinense]MBK3803872.1 lipopolysaccharide heptosyltransferase family protein [Azospirillum argentinense]
MTDPAFDLSSVRRILVVKLDEAGDFVLATPFLRGLRASAPRARIVLAVRPAVADLAETCPHVDAVVAPHPKPGGGIDLRGVTPGGAAAFAEAFRAGFDLTLVPRYDFDRHGATALAANSRARAVVGFSETVTPWKASGNAGFARAYPPRLTPPPGCHEVEQNLALLRFAGGEPDGDGVELRLTAEDRAEAARLLADAVGERIVAVAPGAAAARREYPPERLAAVVAVVAIALGARVAVLGTELERAAAERIAVALPGRVTDLTGRTGLRLAAAVIERTAGLIAMDSGPAHLGAAVGVPVAVFSCHPEGGDPNHFHAPGRFRPWCARALVLRPAAALAPCPPESCMAAEAHCIASLPPELAAAQILALFGGSGDASP